MTEKVIEYHTLQEKEAAIKIWEAKGYRMLHDDLIPQPDDDLEIMIEHGLLTFTNEPEQVIIPAPVRDFGAEIDELKTKVKALEDKVK